MKVSELILSLQKLNEPESDVWIEGPDNCLSQWDGNLSRPTGGCTHGAQPTERTSVLLCSADSSCRREPVAVLVGLPSADKTSREDASMAEAYVSLHTIKPSDALLHTEDTYARCAFPGTVRLITKA